MIETTTLHAMFGLGPLELGIILAIVVIIFGASKLPQLGKGLGEMISGFKRASHEADEEVADIKRTLEDSLQPLESKRDIADRILRRREAAKTSAVETVEVETVEETEHA